ncbi:hypothetical protein JCGZ_14713 [Jatropha curcas]|uniref:Uncharacterized protein n=1 Tax=Jatropha curcas TaxID=180498 RepID=A0A067KJR3_JATCU|nr:uncharacterized protein LOC105639197 [Jatropha curcas]KDP32510.1 hypothetical protein JCGZ_14713 [Jatropha curcas]
MGEVSPATSVHEEDHRSAQKMETACYSLADDSYSVSDSLSVVSVSEMAFSAASSCGSIFTEPCTLHENSFNDVLAVVSCSNRVSVAGHDSHSSNVLSSSISAPVASRDREVAETGSTCSNDVLSLESAGCSNYSSYICDDILDPVMETIDLFDKAKLEESRITVTNSMLYEVSRRTHKLRSYKKRIQDAFTSKKRLSKEYEQLAIWFGDIDLDSSQDTVPGQLEASKTITLDPAMQIDHTCDSEWELL